MSKFKAVNRFSLKRFVNGSSSAANSEKEEKSAAQTLIHTSHNSLESHTHGPCDTPVPKKSSSEVRETSPSRLRAAAGMHGEKLPGSGGEKHVDDVNLESEEDSDQEDDEDYKSGKTSRSQCASL